jgi:hypothetical protein
VKDASGKFVHEAVWRYLFNEPVDKVGEATAHDTSCQMDLSKGAKGKK